MPAKFIAVYITTKDWKEADKISEILLRKRLIACANIMPIRSAYWWKGRIEKHGEALLIAKTKKALYKKILDEVKKHHSYSVPCVNAFPITEGNPDYLKWIENETAK
ncbi:MAG: divalent-cation tolerance protein CutA [Candidatus Aenigmarchaeota archaeon]|nr:divalent-cation tolerance protein CutA [Candidatus Aenigmarchaeota archaeon]